MLASGSRALLDHFPQRHRSWVANTFLGAVRDGIATPEDVLLVVADRVRDDVRQHRRWSSERATDCIARDQRLLALLATDDARSYAIWCTEYERLPRAAREAMRSAVGHVHRAVWMAEQPPTDRQLAYLADLGYEGPPPASKLNASELIDRLKGSR